EPALDADLGAAEDVLAEDERLVDDGMNRDGRRGLDGRARVGDEVAREAEDAPRGLADAAKAFYVVRVGPRALGLAAKVIGIADDRGQGVVELVNDARCDLAEARQLFGLDDLPA